MHSIVLHNSSLECGNHFILPYAVEFRELPELTLNHFFSHQMFLPNAKPAITRRDSCTDHWRRTYQEGIGDLQIMVSCCDHNQQREFQIMQQSLDYLQVLPDILKVLSNIYLTWIYMYFQVGKYFYYGYISYYQRSDFSLQVVRNFYNQTIWKLKNGMLSKRYWM